MKKCNQCDSTIINGIFCHERGCPNINKTYDKYACEWVNTYECPECGMITVEGELCCDFESDGFGYM